MKRAELDRELSQFDDPVNQEGRWLLTLLMIMDDDENGLKEKDFGEAQRVLHLKPAGFENAVLSLQETGMVELLQTTDQAGKAHKVLMLTEEGKKHASLGRDTLARLREMREQKKDIKKSK